MAAETENNKVSPNGETPPYCIFCLKESGSSSFQYQKKKRMRNNYIIPIERFLGLSEFNSSSSFGLQFCPDCSLLLEQFAEQYGMLRKVEMELEWKIGKIKRIMECASRVPSRISLLKEYHHHHHNSSTSTEKGREDKLSLEQVEEWRRRFIRKCATKLVTSFPRVRLTKLEEKSGIGRRSELSSPPSLQVNPSSATSFPSSSSSSSNEGPAVKSESQAFPISNSAVDSSSCINTMIDVGLTTLVFKEELVQTAGTQPHQELIMEVDGAGGTGDPQEPKPTVLLSREELLNDEDSECCEPTQQGEEETDDILEALSDVDDIMEREEEVENELALISSTLTQKELAEESPEEPRRLRAHFRCNKCSKTFSSKGRCDFHQESHDHQAENNGSEELQNDSGDDDDDVKLSFEREEELNEDILSDESPKLDQKPLLQKRRILPKGKLLGRSKATESWQCCEICKARFTSAALLQTHNQVAHDVKDMDPSQVQKCLASSCSAYFRTKRQLECHISKIHDEPAAETNNEEDDGSLGVGPLKVKVPTNPKYQDDRWCSLCRMEFLTPWIYRKHYRRHHDLSNVDPASVLECGQNGCGAYFLLKVQLRRHRFRAHGVSLTNTKRAKYVCFVCPESFTEKPSRQKHYKSWHDVSRLQKPDDVLKCDHQPSCTAYFLTRHQLDLHRKKFHGKLHECSICGMGFRSRSNLNQHRSRVHKTELQLKFTCGGMDGGGCGKKFESEDQLQFHKNYGHKNVQGLEPLSCPKCDKVFQSSDSLRKHMYFHREGRAVGERSRIHICEQCGKGFKDRKGLAIHYKSHAGVNSWEFQCSTCGKKCLTEQKLEEHLRTHTGEKPYCCEHCGVSYAHKHNLRNHVNNKHPEMPPDLPRAFDKTNLTSRKGKNKVRKFK